MLPVTVTGNINRTNKKIINEIPIYNVFFTFFTLTLIFTAIEINILITIAGFCELTYKKL